MLSLQGTPFQIVHFKTVPFSSNLMFVTLVYFQSDIELVASFTPKFADPRMPIPLPDQTNDPPGTHIPPMTPPPIQRLPSPEPNPEQLLESNPGLSITKITNEDISESPEKDIDLVADLGLGPDVELDEDGAPVIHKKVEEKPIDVEQPKAEEKPKINILDQIENEIQQKIKSQEAAKAAEKAKVAEDAKSQVKLQVETQAAEIKPVDEVKIFCEDSKQETPNPEGGEPQLKKIKLDETPTPPPEETNQPGTPIKPSDPGPTSLGSTNGFNPVDPHINNFSPPYSHQIAPQTSHVLGPPATHSIAQSHPPQIPYSTASVGPPISQPNIYQSQLQIPISHHDPTRMHPNQPYPYEPMPNREHYYPMQPAIPNQPPMMQPMQPNFYHPHQPQPQPQPQAQAQAFPNQKQSRFFPYTGYATPIHTFNDTVEPGPDGRLPLDYWNTMSCTVDIPNCPLNCCHVRAHQEIMEGSTNWKVPYGPPLNGLQPCSCCINS